MAASADAAGAAVPLRIGIFPQHPARVTRQMFEPLRDYLERRLGRRVTLEVPADYGSFWQRVERHAYDLVHLNPYQYVKAQRRHGYQAILRNEEFGSATLAGALYVRRDSGIHRVSELKGQKIIFGGGRDAMFAYIAPSDLLRQHGLGAGDYLAQHGAYPPQAAVGLYYGQGAAAGLGEAVIRSPAVTAQIDTSELRLLAKGPALAHRPWAIDPNLPAAVAEQLQGLLLALNHGRQGQGILRAAGLTALRPAQDRDYDPHREIIRRVLGEHY